jgi:hypothetical protein
MIFTSYFARARAHPRILQGELSAVCIARNAPAWFKGKICRELQAPGRLLSDLRNGKIDKVEYKVRYVEQVLIKIDMAALLQEWNRSVFVCWEKPEAFCHRHFFSEFVRERHGTFITELREGWAP